MSINHGPNQRACRALISAAALALVLAPGLYGCRTRSFLSTKQEVTMGQEGAREVEQEFRVDTSSPDAERVRRIGQRLLPHIDRRDIPYSFKVLDSPEINAFSLPGGPVYVYRGLLDFIGNDDDALACIIGHELGHVNARHVARQVSSNFINSLFIDIFIPNPTANAGASILDEIIGLKYSRDEEYEADRRGLSYAHFAGYDPNGLIRFFDKLRRLEKREGGHSPEWLQDHPLTKERIAKAKEIIAQGDYRYGQ